ncbi:TraR/DksA family transcriptional regulator [Streptomyces vinaceus]|uniref:TraR/DksA family transcriptional regulator n=1 Tax=Streptomyces vinaceus TaxID=1960 RepID=UPI0035E357AB
MSNTPRRDREESSRSALAEVHERLAADRADTLARMAALCRDFDGIVAANALVAVDDEHDPEGGTTAFGRAHVTSLLTQAREHLDDLDHALERIEDGEYGRCESCGTTIPPERLAVRPAATTCVTCAQPGPRHDRR